MRAVIASFALLAGVVIGVTFTAATGSSASPSGGGTSVHYHAVGGNEVVSRDVGCPPTGSAVNGIIGSPGCSGYVAAVHLPDGAIVTQMKVVYDDSVATDGVFGLFKSDLPMEEGDSDTGYRIDSVDTPGKTSEIRNGNLVIDNSSYHYHFALNLTPGIQFFSALLTYTLPDSGATNANGDVDCNGNVAARDQQAVLRFILGQPALSQTEPCPDLGS